MNSPTLQARIDTAMDLAERAGGLAMSMRPPPGSPHGTMKGPQDWVTEADGEVEFFLSQELAAAFPADGFQGEEGGISRGGSLRWLVDPIDWTSNFARGAARFCVSLACLEGNTPLIGIVVAPAAKRSGHGVAVAPGLTVIRSVPPKPPCHSRRSSRSAGRGGEPTRII